MANRLGLPMEMVSNKGSKFIGTKAELEELVDVLKNKNKNNKQKIIQNKNKEIY